MLVDFDIGWYNHDTIRYWMVQPRYNQILDGTTMIQSVVMDYCRINIESSYI